MLKEYEYGINNGMGLYFIDANLLVALGNYYYKAKCKPFEITSEVVEFLLRARKYGIQNQFSLIELCYDYNTNTLNSSLMQKIMIAYDYLIMQMGESEIRSHKGALEPDIVNNEKRTRSFSSIFECKLPDFLFENDYMGLKNAFYGIYLYMLKVYLLYSDKRIEPIEKIKSLFSYMVNDIDVILANEFFTASMLFIGENAEKDIVMKILKPRENPELQHILNATIDVFQVKIAELFAQMFELNKKPCFVRFATLDKPLQDYIEHVAQYNTTISPNMISSLNSYNVKISGRYREEWTKFYNETVEPTMRKRFFEAHLKHQSFDFCDTEKIYREIINLENRVLKVVKN